MTLLREWSGYSSERPLRYDAVRAILLRAEEGTVVELSLVAPDGAEHELALAADRAGLRPPRLPVPVPGVSDRPNVSWTRLAGGVGYIRVRRMREDLIPRLDAAVAELQDARGIVIDARGNGGGGFDGRRATLNFALEGADVEPERPRYRGPLAVLVDGRCISAGEGWVSWFRAAGRATFFGETTAGASSRKEEHDVAGGLYRVRVPVRAYRGALDRPIERLGIEPDVALRPTAADLARGADTVLEAARVHVWREALTIGE
jgi:C-terminal processing protease CtpA/Prc